MTWFEDLSPYTYFKDGGGQGWQERNVGWLGKDHPFPTGPVPKGVLAFLQVLARHPKRICRGFHQCEFCNERVPGNGEIHVHGGYVAPVMIIHYIEAHNYQPPEEFCKAVVEGYYPKVQCPNCKGRGEISVPCPRCAHGVSEAEAHDCTMGRENCMVCLGRGYVQ